MASGSSGRTTNSGSKAFDFGSDDILCSYEDYGNQDGNNNDLIANPAKEFNKSRVARSSVFPAANYGTPEETSFNEGLISTVENSMKKYTDNLMRFLEGISSRLSQLELYCYNLDKSIGEMRSDLSRDHGESDSKLKSLERHIQEVHRSVQILRDKQELADTQKELAKLQLAHKESTSNEDRASEAKKGGGSELNNPPPSESNANDQQLPLALPHQHQQQHQQQVVASLPQQPSMAPQIPPPQPPPPSSSNMAPYYLPPSPQFTSNMPYQVQQDLSRMATQPQLNQQTPPPAQIAYQQQWPPQQQQIRTSSQLVYSSYHSPPDMPMPAQAASFMGTSQPTSEALPSYAAASRHPIQQQPLKPTNTPSGGDVSYVPRPPANVNNNAYMVFDAEGGRTPHHHHPHHPQPPHFQQQQSVYPPNTNIPPPQRMPMRTHPYSELIDKLVGMGYRGDHVVAIIQRLEESGQQPIDFNSVLDRLNGHSHSHSGGGSGSQRGWST